MQAKPQAAQDDPIRHTPAVPTVICLILRVGLGAAFSWASRGKIADPAALARVVPNYPIRPPALANPAAVILPWVEAVCGACRITGVLIRGSLLLFNGRMAVFSLALVWKAWRGPDTDRGC